MTTPPCDTVSSSPLLSRYRMPAEWHRHAGCLILYPHNKLTYPFLESAQSQVLEVARAIAGPGQEPVLLLCLDAAEREKVNNLLTSDTSASETTKPIIHVQVCPSNDTWARDTAPTFVLAEMDQCEESSTDNTTANILGIDWDFNAYGGPEEGCYWPCDRDQQVAKNICRLLSNVTFEPSLSLPSTVPSVSVPLILEGGSIHTDGEGTLLTTKECLLNKNRNPSYSQSQIEQILLHSLGCKKVIWLPNGVHGDDDTNGHVDNWACFVRPGHVVLAWTDDSEQDAENYQRCRLALEILQKETDARGRALTVHKLYLPSPPLFYKPEEVEEMDKGHDAEEAIDVHAPRQVGERMAASYINFYIANQAIIVPQYGGTASDTDAKAMETLQQLFPDRQAVGVASRVILTGGGNIHCITQQIPECR